MVRIATFVALLATFTNLCQGAPLYNDRRDVSASNTTSSSTSTPIPSATASVTSTTPSTSSSPHPSGTRNTTSTAFNTSSSSPSSPSTSTQSATSTATLTPGTNWTAFANGTRGYALHQLLTQGISQDAPQRWVTTEGISSTNIGGSDPGLSNKDLEKAVNTVFGNGSSHQTWVETYWQFLVHAGNSSASRELMKNVTANQNVYATEQVKLVRAYGAAHPGNVSYVGVNVTNLVLVPAIDIAQMEDWASSGAAVNCTSGASANLTSRTVGNSTSSTFNATSSSSGNSTSGGSGNCNYDSDGPYTADDYKKYSAARNHWMVYESEYQKSGFTSQMAFKGYALERTFQGVQPIGIFNLSMDTGGSGAYTDFVPAWRATVVGWGAKNSTSYQALESNLGGGLSDSTSNITDSLDLGAGLDGRDGHRTRRLSAGFGALQFVAQGLKPVQSDSPSAPVSEAAAAAPAVASTDPLDQPLPDSQTLMLLRLQEGTWADKRAEFIQWTRENTPDLVDSYFGPENSGSGPIGRHWTHLVLIVNTDTPQTSAQLLGNVYEVVPTGSANATTAIRGVKNTFAVHTRQAHTRQASPTATTTSPE
ncbi:hypothetical protein C8R47DRAFT_1068950 [Mycena vitilis]|nr:hypothetical protein C8R47DRAFT_1068950 [Mycena vitilis]